MTPDERLELAKKEAKWVQIEEHPKKISTSLLRTQVQVAVLNGIKLADPETQIEVLTSKPVVKLEDVRKQISRILAANFGRDDDGMPRVACQLYNRDTHFMPPCEPIPNPSYRKTLPDYERAEAIAAFNLTVAHDRWQLERKLLGNKQHEVTLEKAKARSKGEQIEG